MNINEDKLKLTQIRKRDGQIVTFNKSKVSEAIWRAASSVGGTNRETSDKLSLKVIKSLESKCDESTVPSVENIQDLVEKILIEEGHASVAKSYILYRQNRSDLRRAKALLGVEDDLKLNLNAVTILSARYLLRDESRNIIETPKQLFQRVANAIAEADLSYDTSADATKTAADFYQMMINFEFLPNSPTLMNAGTELGQLSACFVLPVNDSMEGIFNTIKHTAIIHKSGGGTGFSFSRIRPKGDAVKSTGGVASGPLSFMSVFDSATNAIKQGGKRRGANMGILRVDHPDILDFITAKEKEGRLANFNISVGVTNKFMEATINDEEYELINPRNDRVHGKLNARVVWNLIVAMAWKNGEPGIIFIDKINEAHQIPICGPIESTNPCGEQPLVPYESCNLGSINLSKMVSDGQIDWNKLANIIVTGVHFLDNVIDVNRYPISEIEHMTKKNRKIGLGVMGFADMLIQLGVPYNSRSALKIAEQVMRFIEEKAVRASSKLAESRGSFDNFVGSLWEKRGLKSMRNGTVTTIAPTGTISEIAGCSNGIEPLFAVIYTKNVSETLGQNLTVINPQFEKMAIEEDFYSDDLMKKVSRITSIQQTKEIPENVRGLFVTAHDITPEWHVKMQSSFQKYVDNAVSKTINFPNYASMTDIEQSYLLAYKRGCKGITVYRNDSRATQILLTPKEDEENPDETLSSDAPIEYFEKCEACNF